MIQHLETGSGYQEKKEAGKPTHLCCCCCSFFLVVLIDRYMEETKKHTCLKLLIAVNNGEGETKDKVTEPIFVKSTWFPTRFDLAITDGLNAWLCNGTCPFGSCLVFHYPFAIWSQNYHKVFIFFVIFDVGVVSIGGGGEAACFSVGPASFGVCGAGWAVLGVSATWFPLRLCWCWWWP